MDKPAILRELVEKLIDPDRRRLERQLYDLNNRNKSLKRLQVDGFIYGGTYFLPATGTVIAKSTNQAAQSLHPSLWDEMEQWQSERKSFNNDGDLIRQALFVLTQACMNERDLRDALPECLISLVPGLSAYARSRPQGYTIEFNARAWRQFEKILPKIEALSVARLLF